ncbi:MAG: NUDIX domain-containing protein [Candidatus Peregrinibacteria bacterium]
MVEAKYDEKSCGIVVFRESGGVRMYLVLKYPGGHFDFPKGHVEADETEHETALRELAEETGITDVEFVEGFRKQISYIYNKKGKRSDKEVIFFLGKTQAQNVRLSHEHRDFVWLEYDMAFNKVTFDNAKNLLRAAEKLLGPSHG